MNPDFLGLLAAIHGGRGLLPLQPGAMPNVPSPPMRLPVPNIPMAPPAPQVPATQSQGSLWDRIQARLFPVPDALGGILSPDDIASSRRSGFLNAGAAILAANAPRVGRPGATLGEAVAAGLQGLQQGFGGGLGQALQSREFARTEREAQREEEKRLRIEGLRTQVAEKYPLRPDMTPQQTASNLQKQFTELLSGGDIEGARTAAQVLQTQANLLTPPDEKAVDQDVRYETRRTGPNTGELIKYSNNTGKEIGREPIYFERPASLTTMGMVRPRIGSAINPATGRNELAVLSPEGAEFLGVDAPSTMDQRQAAADLPLLQESVSEIERLTDPAKGPQKGVSLIEYATGKGGVIGNLVKGDVYRQYQQAVNEFMSVYPFSRGGKQLTPTEAAAIRSSLEILPGDDAATKVRKIKSFRLRVSEIRQKAGGTVPQGKPSQGGTTYKLPDGSTFKVP